jgi:hypothetical protein
MDTFEIIIALTLVLGIGYVLYLILQDPVLLLKSLLRGLKNNDNWKTLIVFFPIWGPIWLVDRVFNLKIYIKNIEEASKPKHINFKDFDKYILVNTNDKEFIEKVIKSFLDGFDPKEYHYNLDGSYLKMTDLENEIVIKIEKEERFDSFNALIQYLDNSAPQNQIYNVKGVLLNRQNRTESYFVFFDTAFLLKLVGKSYQNKKLYVDIDPEKGNNEIIYFNSNIDYFKNFNFDKFESTIKGLSFTEIWKKPSP